MWSILILCFHKKVKTSEEFAGTCSMISIFYACLSISRTHTFHETAVTLLWKLSSVSPSLSEHPCSEAQQRLWKMDDTRTPLFFMIKDGSNFFWLFNCLGAEKYVFVLKLLIFCDAFVTLRNWWRLEWQRKTWSWGIYSTVQIKYTSYADVQSLGRSVSDQCILAPT